MNGNLFQVRKATFAIPAAVLLCCLVMPACFDSHLRAQSATEPELKAAFLYHFAQFIEWPPDVSANSEQEQRNCANCHHSKRSKESVAASKAPITFCVVGDDSFAEVLGQALEDKIIRGQNLLVQQWEQSKNSHPCNVLFVASSAKNTVAEILRTGDGRGVLIVGETEGFAKRGGMINFILSDKKLGFEINRKSAESAGLKISSRLLTLAKAVWE